VLLEAHHVRAVAAGGSNDPEANGRLQCKRHYAMVEGRRAPVRRSGR
jgi:hypothetical protein